MVEFGKLNKTIQLPTEPEKLLEDMPFKIEEKLAGKRIRTQDMFVELGGPKVKAAAELIEFYDDENELEDGKIEIWGPDIDELDEGSSYSFVEIVSLSGSKLNEIDYGIFERNISIYQDFIEGIMHLNMRNLILIRIHKQVAKKGIKFEHIARALMGQLKTNLPQIEKIEIKFFIDSAQNPKQTLRILNDECYYIWNQRNLAVLSLDDDNVDNFYGCNACRYHYPNHTCIITPNNYGTCGVINWNNVNSSIDIDQTGYFFKIDKGEKLDDLYGDYTGINSMIYEYTNKAVGKVNLYSVITNPQTSCGLFEALVFYIADVDALGIASYSYKGDTPLGITLSTMNKIYNRNIQTPGYRGIALMALMDNKFIQADGGWKRVVWMDQNLKENIINWIPQELKEKIATEETAKSAKDLKIWISKKGHPLKNEKWNGKTWIKKK